MPSRSAEPTHWEHSHSRTCRAFTRGSFSVAYGKGWPQPHATATTQTTIWPAILTPEVVPQWGEYTSQPPTPPPGFVEIAWSLCGDRPLRIVTGIPLELAEDQSPIQMIGSSMMSAYLVRDLTLGAICIDMVTCSMNLMGMGLNPTADDHHVPTLWEATHSD